MTDMHERPTTDYERTIRVQAAPGALFDALTDVAGLTAWWTRATGSGTAGGDLEFFLGSPAPCAIHVDEAVRATSVRWTVTACEFLPDWVGTRPSFTITPVGGGASELRFRHHGLTRELDCIAVCTRGWDHYLASLRDVVEVGCGSPHGSSADTARRVREDAAAAGATAAKVALGRHSAVRVRRSERPRIRAFYRDVLGCEVMRESDRKDDLRMGGDFYLALLWEADDAVLGEDGFRKATYLELATDDVEETRRRIVAFGVTVLDVPDPHLYFQAPGGQVLRVVGASEDLSRYEGTEHNEHLVGVGFEPVSPAGPPQCGTSRSAG